MLTESKPVKLDLDEFMEDFFKNVFKVRLKELRKERRLTQSDICKEFDIPAVTTYCGWEHQGKEPSYKMLISFAKFFDVTTDYLLGLSDERKPTVIEKPLDLSTVPTDDMMRELIRRWK